MKSALATALRGIEIENGWVIEEPRAKCAGATGACHAIGFTGKHADAGRAFVNVLDLTLDPTLEGRAQLKELERRLDVFIYEVIY